MMRQNSIQAKFFERVIYAATLRAWRRYVEIFGFESEAYTRIFALKCMQGWREGAVKIRKGREFIVGVFLERRKESVKMQALSKWFSCCFASDMWSAGLRQFALRDRRFHQSMPHSLHRSSFLQLAVLLSLKAELWRANTTESRRGVIIYADALEWFAWSRHFVAWKVFAHLKVAASRRPFPVITASDIRRSDRGSSKVRIRKTKHLLDRTLNVESNDSALLHNEHSSYHVTHIASACVKLWREFTRVIQCTPSGLVSLVNNTFLRMLCKKCLMEWSFLCKERINSDLISRDRTNGFIGFSRQFGTNPLKSASMYESIRSNQVAISVWISWRSIVERNRRLDRLITREWHVRQTHEMGDAFVAWSNLSNTSKLREKHVSSASRLRRTRILSSCLLVWTQSFRNSSLETAFTHKQIGRLSNKVFKLWMFRASDSLRTSRIGSRLQCKRIYRLIMRFFSFWAMHNYYRRKAHHAESHTSTRIRLRALQGTFLSWLTVVMDRSAVHNARRVAQQDRVVLILSKVMQRWRMGLALSISPSEHQCERPPTSNVHKIRTPVFPNDTIDPLSGYTGVLPVPVGGALSEVVSRNNYDELSGQDLKIEPQLRANDSCMRGRMSIVRLIFEIWRAKAQSNLRAAEMQRSTHGKAVGRDVISRLRVFVQKQKYVKGVVSSGVIKRKLRVMSTGFDKWVMFFDERSCIRDAIVSHKQHASIVFRRLSPNWIMCQSSRALFHYLCNTTFNIYSRSILITYLLVWSNNVGNGIFLRKCAVRSAKHRQMSMLRDLLSAWNKFASIQFRNPRARHDPSLPASKWRLVSAGFGIWKRVVVHAHNCVVRVCTMEDRRRVRIVVACFQRLCSLREETQSPFIHLVIREARRLRASALKNCIRIWSSQIGLRKTAIKDFVDTRTERRRLLTKDLFRTWRRLAEAGHYLKQLAEIRCQGFSLSNQKAHFMGWVMATKMSRTIAKASARTAQSICTLIVTHSFYVWTTCCPKMLARRVRLLQCREAPYHKSDATVQTDRLQDNLYFHDAPLSCEEAVLIRSACDASDFELFHSNSTDLGPCGLKAASREKDVGSDTVRDEQHEDFQHFQKEIADLMVQVDRMQSVMENMVPQTQMNAVYGELQKYMVLCDALRSSLEAPQPSCCGKSCQSHLILCMAQDCVCQLEEQVSQLELHSLSWFDRFALLDCSTVPPVPSPASQEMCNVEFSTSSFKSSRHWLCILIGAAGGLSSFAYTVCMLLQLKKVHLPATSVDFESLQRSQPLGCMPEAFAVYRSNFVNLLIFAFLFQLSRSIQALASSATLVLLCLIAYAFCFPGAFEHSVILYAQPVIHIISLAVLKKFLVSLSSWCNCSEFIPRSLMRMSASKFTFLLRDEQKGMRMLCCFISMCIWAGVILGWYYWRKDVPPDVSVSTSDIAPYSFEPVIAIRGSYETVDLSIESDRAYENFSFDIEKDRWGADRAMKNSKTDILLIFGCDFPPSAGEVSVHDDDGDGFLMLEQNPTKGIQLDGKEQNAHAFGSGINVSETSSSLSEYGISHSASTFGVDPLLNPQRTFPLPEAWQLVQIDNSDSEATLRLRLEPESNESSPRQISSTIAALQLGPISNHQVTIQSDDGVLFPPKEEAEAARESSPLTDVANTDIPSQGNSSETGHGKLRESAAQDLLVFPTMAAAIGMMWLWIPLLRQRPIALLTPSHGLKTVRRARAR